jgi:hypothetical protein
VTLDEALAELGLDLGASTDEARRAYLRLLKTRKPEVDREGFMRLREAYERARAELPFYEAMRRADADAPTRIPVATPGGLVWIETSQPPDEPPRPPAVVSEPATDKPTATAEAPENTPAEGLTDPIVSPDEPRPEEPPAADDARAGTHLPWGEPPPAHAHAHAPRETQEPQPSVEGLHANGKNKAAAKLATRLYREATERGDDDGALPRPRTTLRILLALHQRNKLAEAGILQKSFAAWLDASGLEARILTGELAVLWSVARELTASPGSLPLEVRAAIAEAALLGDLGHARADCIRFRHAQPLLARAAAGELRAHAPSLAASFAEVLDPPAPRPVDANPRRGLWFIIPILIGVLRLIAVGAQNSTSSSYTPSYTYRGPINVTPPMPALDAGPAPRSIWDVVDASHAEPVPAPDASAAKPKKSPVTRGASHAKDPKIDP